MDQTPQKENEEKVGQRPSRTEWEMSDPKIAYNTYKQRFGGWTNACLKFIEYKMGSSILAEDFVLPNREGQESLKDSKVEYKQENSRNVSLSLRLQVLSSMPENLQTLCEECNLGKSNKSYGK